MEIINIKSLTKKYGNLLILSGINFSVNESEFISVVGPFGCGKTTLIKIIAGLIDDYSGEIKINGDSPLIARRNRKIGYSSQKTVLLPWRNVFQNIFLPKEIAGRNTNSKNLKLIKELNIYIHRNKFPHQISGGTQQLVSIIRSLILDPDILLLDEPFSSLDEITRSEMQSYLQRIHRETKKTTIMITHSIPEAVFLSNKVIILSSQPSRVKRIMSINMKKRDENIRYSKEFNKYVSLIRSQLKNAKN